MFGKGEDKKEPAQGFKDEFRKPTWFEESETDDELFDSKNKVLFQIFTNPLELQKHFDQQMQELLKNLKQYEETEDFERNFRDEYMKPGFKESISEKFKQHAKAMDTDLDGEIYADQLHSLLQRFAPDMRLIPENEKRKPLQPKVKLSDEETIMGRIHGTISDGTEQPPARRRDKFLQKIPPQFGGVFDGTYQGPKMFGQSIMTQTTRKPDGSYETKRVIRDTEGNVKTTITRSADGKTETITTYGDEKGKESIKGNAQKKLPVAAMDANTSSELRNLFVSKEGYALPRNLW